MFVVKLDIELYFRDLLLLFSKIIFEFVEICDSNEDEFEDGNY